VKKKMAEVEQKFALLISRVIDQESKKMHVSMKTKGEGIPLAEAVIIVEGWVKKVKEEMQKPYTEKLTFI
jgi:hypothetical protein